MATEEPAVFENSRDALAAGMRIAFTASRSPERPAILSERGNLTYGELNARANQLARALRARGLSEGDSVALMCSNRPEFAEVYVNRILHRDEFRALCDEHGTREKILAAL